MGCGVRKCMMAQDGHPQLPHAKPRDNQDGPGPGTYTAGDAAVMGHRGRTFAAADERRRAEVALARAAAQLKTLEWRIATIRRGIRDPDK